MSARTLIAELRLSGVELRAEGDRLRYAGPEGAVTPGLVERMRRHKPELMKLLNAERNAERRKLEAANRRGLIVRWSEYPSWIELHDPLTGEWHEVLASECLPSVVETANNHRRRGGAAGGFAASSKTGRPRGRRGDIASKTLSGTSPSGRNRRKEQSWQRASW